MLPHRFGRCVSMGMVLQNWRACDLEGKELSFESFVEIFLMPRYVLKCLGCLMFI